jgi:hypothetical protein
MVKVGIDVGQTTVAKYTVKTTYAETLIGSIRRECLDHVVVFGERHLRSLLRSYQQYYNECRTRLSLDAPLARASNCPWSHHGRPRSWWTTSPILPRLSFRQGHNIEPMSEKEILHFELALGPEQAGDKGSKQMEDCEHRPILR